MGIVKVFPGLARDRKPYSSQDSFPICAGIIFVTVYSQSNSYRLCLWMQSLQSHIAKGPEYRDGENWLLIFWSINSPILVPICDF